MITEKDLIMYRPFILESAAKLTQNHEDAEDITQLVLMKIWRYRNHYKEQGTKKAWIKMILKNEFINTYRKQKTIPPMMDVKQCRATVEKADGLNDKTYLAMMSLTKSERDLIGLRIKGYKYDEISEITNTNIGTVRSRLHKTRAKFIKKLKKLKNK